MLFSWKIGAKLLENDTFIVIQSPTEGLLGPRPNGYGLFAEQKSLQVSNENYHTFEYHLGFLKVWVSLNLM